MGNQQTCCIDNADNGQMQSIGNSIKYARKISNFETKYDKIKPSLNKKNVFSGKQMRLQQIDVVQTSSKQIENPIKQEKGQMYQVRQLFANDKDINQSKISNLSSQCLFPQNRNSYLNPQKNLQQANLISFIQNNKLKPTSDVNSNDIKPRQPENQSLKNTLKHEASEKIRNSNASQLSMPSSQFNPQISTISSKKTTAIEFLPLVKKVIDRQSKYFNYQKEPFERQFSQISQQKIKILRVNNKSDTFKGQLDYYQKPHGYGVLIKQNGNALIGKFNHGMTEGKMFYVLKDGTYYKGQIGQEKANDHQGEYHSLKMTYIGGFSNNMFNGEGKQMTDDSYFVGEYQNNLKIQGKYCWDLKKYKNQNLNQQKQIQAEQTIPFTRDFTEIPLFNYQYLGYFDQNQQFTGMGRLRDPNGQYYGYFSGGKKQGKGEYRFDNKLLYIGEYQNNKKHGYGKLYNCDNSLAYEGFWKDDLPDGKGISYDQNGNKNSYEFVRGLNKIVAPQT